LDQTVSEATIGQQLAQPARRLARAANSTTATVTGFAALALLAAFAPILVAAHQLTLSNFGTPFLIEAPYVVVGLIVARRQPSNPIGWLLLLIGSATALSGDCGYYAWTVYGRGHHGLPLGPIALLLGNSTSLFALLGLPMVVLLFPDGRVPSGHWRWVVLGYCVIGAIGVAGQFAFAASALLGHHVNAATVSPGGGSIVVNQPSATRWLSRIDFPAVVAFVLLVLASVAHQVRSWRRSSGVRRQQLKSLMAGGIVCVLALLALGSGTANGNSSDLVEEIWSQVPWIAFAALPISISVAVLRYRLYEVDRLISRTLSYALLTGLLVGTFVGLVALTTDTFALSGRVGVAASTLIAAALFNPLRIRIQRVVDRRFNRARYNAEATVAAFTARLRDAVEIDAIRADLLDAVNRAVQPTHAAIWIKEEAANR
jgi:hypothetical protein